MERKRRPADVRSEFFIVPSTASLPAPDTVWIDQHDGSAIAKDATTMDRNDYDDVPLLYERLRLGLPMRGFDGRAIPLRDAAGDRLSAIDAAQSLLRSGASLLSPDYAEAFIAAALDRAAQVEIEARRAGASVELITAKVTAVLVSAAVRASVIARGPDVSPSAINRATLSWYELNRLRRRELLLSAGFGEDTRQSA